MKLYVAGVGVGMGPLAFIARDLGWDVVCSDVVEHELVAHMRANGFTVHIGQDGSAIQKEHATSPIDWFVHSAALPDTNPELTFATQNRIKTSKRDTFINQVLSETKLEMIAVAGTHGKTNTTAMLAWCLQQAGVPVSYSIGALLPFGPFGKYQPDSRYFIYEADEFDKNFLNYRPAISLITNIDFDHPDTYPTQADYDLAYAQFIGQSQSVYMYAEDFGGTSENVHLLQKDDNESSTRLPGRYIRQNARLVIELLEQEFGIPHDESIAMLNDFPGSSRRLERLHEGVYSDYAHHPAEIKATLDALREVSDRLVVVYQPHQNIRQHQIKDLYQDCFQGAQHVYWLPTYLSREDETLPILSPQEIIAGLSNQSIVSPVEMDTVLLSKLHEHQEQGATIVAMAAGNLDSWMRSHFGEN